MFSGESISVVIGSVNCFGNETDILQCSYLTDGFEEVSSCDTSQVAGVVCQGVPFVCTYIQLLHSRSVSLFTDPITQYADCTTGEVRLADISNNLEEQSRQGTAQICVNNAWGSICSDNFFDNTDAAVFCGQLEGFKAAGMPIPLNTVKQLPLNVYYPPGATELPSSVITTSSKPLFLSSLDCTEGHYSLLDDCSHETLGLASCSDDFGLVVVKCFGKSIVN